MKDAISLIQAVNWGQVAAAVFAAFWSHSMSVRLGNGVLSASANGAPVHVAPDQILAAAFLAYSGQAASIQVGSVLVTYTPNATAAPAVAAAA